MCASGGVGFMGLTERVASNIGGHLDFGAPQILQEYFLENFLQEKFGTQRKTEVRSVTIPRDV
jgi:hypothetical protein